MITKYKSLKIGSPKTNNENSEHVFIDTAISSGFILVHLKDWSRYLLKLSSIFNVQKISLRPHIGNKLPPIQKSGDPDRATIVRIVTFTFDEYSSTIL